MWPARERLGIDVGTATTTAVLCMKNGTRVPLLLDGTPAMHSGVYVTADTGEFITGQAGRAAAVNNPQAYVPSPITLLGANLVVAGRPVHGVELVAAVLRHIAAEAMRAAGGPPGTVCLTVPPEWGPRRRHLMLQAATMAGLPPPDLVAAPVAVADHLAGVTGDPPPVGACVLVCDAGASGLHLSVLQHEVTGMTVLATRGMPGVGSAGDGALAGHTVAAARIPRPRLPSEPADAATGEVLGQQRTPQQTKQDASLPADTQTTPPKPPSPGMFGGVDVDAVLTAQLQPLPIEIGEVLQAADIDYPHLAAVILTGGGAHLPGLADTIGAGTGRTPLIPSDPVLGAADGATRTTASAPANPLTTGPRVRLTVRHLASPVLLAVASIGLLTHALTTAHVGTINSSPAWVRASSEQIAAGGLLAMLTALAVAYLAPTTMLSGATPAPLEATLIRRTYTGAAAIGLTVAVLYGMIPNAYFGLRNSPYEAGPVLAALPGAAVALTAALLAARVPPHALAAWLIRIRHPHGMALLAVAGIVAMNHAVYAPPTFPGFALLGPAGAACVGVAIAGTIARQRALRVISSAVLAVGGAAVFSLANARLLTLVYVGAAGFWALTAITATARAAFPGAARTLRTIIDSATGPPVPPSAGGR